MEQALVHTGDDFKNEEVGNIGWRLHAMGSNFLILYLIIGGLSLMTTTSCEAGVPLYIYVMGGSLVVCAALSEITFLTECMNLLPQFKSALPKAQINIVFTILGHVGMFNHMTTISVAKACDSHVTQRLQESFSQAHLDFVPILNFMPDVQTRVPDIIGDFHVWGLMMLLYVLLGFLPEYLFMNAMGTTFTVFFLWVALSSFLRGGLWYISGGFALFIVMSVIFQLVTMPANRRYGGVCRRLDDVDGRNRVSDLVLDGVQNMAMRTNFSVLFALAGSCRSEPLSGDYAPQQVAQPFAKIIWESLVLSYVQTSLFCIGFDSFGFRAKYQCLVSILVGLALSCKNMFGIFQRWRSFNLSDRQRGRMQIFVPLCVACGLTCVIILRLMMAFICPSHIWNISSGCVVI